MTTIHIHHVALGRCRVAHGPSGTSLETDSPSEYGGGGSSFSATDLLAAALGTCIATSLDRILARCGCNPTEMHVTVEKTLRQTPKAVKRLAVTIFIPSESSAELIRKTEAAIKACPVHRALRCEITHDLRFLGASYSATWS